MSQPSETMSTPAAAMFAEGDAAGRLSHHLGADHRAKDFQMRSPIVHAVPPGTFAAWMKRRDKLGGQNKVPRIINDQALFEDLKSFAGHA